MTLGNALVYSLLGISVVFFALVLLMILCRVILVALADKPKAETAPAEKPAAAPAPKATAPGSAGEIKLFDTDPRDAAMIMAIVADDLKMPLNELRFISIKEVKE